MSDLGDKRRLLLRTRAWLAVNPAASGYLYLIFVVLVIAVIVIAAVTNS